MTSGENRRGFLGALLLAGGSGAAFAESYRNGAGRDAPAGTDSLFDYIQQQLTTTVRAVQTRGVTLGPEDATAAAACMRICAAHAHGLNIDNTTREALTRRLSTAGRDAFLATIPELTGLRVRLRRKGLVLSERLARDIGVADQETKLAAVEAILGGRATLVCDRLAEAFEAAVPRLIEQRRSIRPAVARDPWWCSFYVSRWTLYLALAQALAQLQDPEVQDFVDTVWAGFVLYDELYQSQCVREHEVGREV